MLDTGEKKEKKRNVIQPLCVIGWEETHWKRERESWSIVWAPQSEQETQRDIQPFEMQSKWRDTEIHSENVREWKRKSRHFSLLKLHLKKINWWSSLEVFKCYNHGDLECSEEDFTTGFMVKLYLLLEI